MSHIVKLSTTINDLDLFKELAEEAGLEVREKHTVKMYGGIRRTGMVVYLPGWSYPIVINEKGEVQYDNYNGYWGDQAQLDSLIQNYLVAAVYKEAISRGAAVEIETLDDGTIQLKMPAMAFA